MGTSGKSAHQAAASTVSSLFAARAGEAPDAIAIREGERTRSYGEVLQRVRRLAGALESAGVEAGDPEMAHCLTLVEPRLVPAEIMRGFALIARCAGLVGHIREEQQQPAMKALWLAGEEAVPFRGAEPTDPTKENHE